MSNSQFVALLPPIRCQYTHSVAVIATGYPVAIATPFRKTGLGTRQQVVCTKLAQWILPRDRLSSHCSMRLRHKLHMGIPPQPRVWILTLSLRS